MNVFMMKQKLSSVPKKLFSFHCEFSIFGLISVSASRRGVRIHNPIPFLVNF